MELRNRITVVTGGAHGIGQAMALAFAQEGAAHVVVADLDESGARAVADRCGGTGLGLDVADPDAVAALVEQVETDIGPIDLFCSNAGIISMGGIETPDDEWRRIIDINTMAHVYAARAVVPVMVARGGGYLLNTASAAGLLAQVGSLPYTVTKHAAVAVAEWLAISHGHQGIKVSVLCPQAVNTAMVAGTEGGGVAGLDGLLEPDDVARCVVEGLADERFWILPHPEVEKYARHKAADIERWLGAMQGLHARFAPEDFSGQVRHVVPVPLNPKEPGGFPRTSADR